MGESGEHASAGLACRSAEGAWGRGHRAGLRAFPGLVYPPIPTWLRNRCPFYPIAVSSSAAGHQPAHLDTPRCTPYTCFSPGRGTSTLPARLPPLPAGLSPMGCCAPRRENQTSDGRTYGRAGLRTPRTGPESAVHCTGQDGRRRAATTTGRRVGRRIRPLQARGRVESEASGSSGDDPKRGCDGRRD